MFLDSLRRPQVAWELGLSLPICLLTISVLPTPLIARNEACSLMASRSCSLGNFLPRKSVMHLSTFGGVHTSISGCGCSLKNASRSSFDIHFLKCLHTNLLILAGALKVPSLFLTREAGSNGKGGEWSTKVGGSRIRTKSHLEGSGGMLPHENLEFSTLRECFWGLLTVVLRLRCIV